MVERQKRIFKKTWKDLELHGLRSTEIENIFDSIAGAIRDQYGD